MVANPDVRARELGRLDALRSYGILDTGREAVFDRITSLAAELLDVPISLITLVDEHRQWFKSAHGLEAIWTPREGGFCSYTVTCERPAIIEDATNDPMFAVHPMVVGDPHIRLYAGAPLITRDGFALGTLCVIDSQPRRLNARELSILTSLAALVMDHIETRLWAIWFAEEEEERHQREYDLSASRAAAAELRQANERNAALEKAKMSFLNVASHELRTPLSLLAGYVELLDDPEFRRNERAAGEARAVMRAKAADMNDLVNRMLRMAELDTASAGADVDLRELLDAVIKQAQAGAPQLRFDLQSPAETVVVRGDHLRLGLVFENLLENSVKRSPEGGVVVCRMLISDGTAIVEIFDDGSPDIEAETLQLLAGSDGPLIPSAIDAPGLGLYLVHQVVLAHGGNVEMRAPDGGSHAVVVKLPARRRRLARADVAKGRDIPTDREMEVGRLVAQGLTNGAIAARLFVSPATVASHVAHLLGKLGFKSRAQVGTWIAQVDREKSSDRMI